MGKFWGVFVGIFLWNSAPAVAQENDIFKSDVLYIARHPSVSEFHFLKLNYGPGLPPGMWHHYMLKFIPQATGTNLRATISFCKEIVYDQNYPYLCQASNKYVIRPSTIAAVPPNQVEFYHRFYNQPLLALRGLVTAYEGLPHPNNYPISYVTTDRPLSSNCPLGYHTATLELDAASLVMLEPLFRQILARASLLSPTWGYGINPGQWLPGQVQLSYEAATRVAAEQAVALGLFYFVVIGGSNAVASETIPNFYSLVQRIAGTTYAQAVTTYLAGFLAQNFGPLPTLRAALSAIAYYRRYY